MRKKLILLSLLLMGAIIAGCAVDEPAAEYDHYGPAVIAFDNLQAYTAEGEYMVAMDIEEPLIISTVNFEILHRAPDKSLINLEGDGLDTFLLIEGNQLTNSSALGVNFELGMFGLLDYIFKDHNAEIVDNPVDGEYVTYKISSQTLEHLGVDEKLLEGSIAAWAALTSFAQEELDALAIQTERMMESITSTLAAEVVIDTGNGMLSKINVSLVFEVAVPEPGDSFPETLAFAHNIGLSFTSFDEEFDFPRAELGDEPEFSFAKDVDMNTVSQETMRRLQNILNEIGHPPQNTITVAPFNARFDDEGNLLVETFVQNGYYYAIYDLDIFVEIYVGEELLASSDFFMEADYYGPLASGVSRPMTFIFPSNQAHRDKLEDIQVRAIYSFTR